MPGCVVVRVRVKVKIKVRIKVRVSVKNKVRVRVRVRVKVKVSVDLFQQLFCRFSYHNRGEDTPSQLKLRARVKPKRDSIYLVNISLAPWQ